MFIDVSCIFNWKGDRGSIGPPGPTGISGEGTGSEGEALPGADGDKGYPGEEGSDGIRGLPGDRGEDVSIPTWEILNVLCFICFDTTVFLDGMYYGMLLSIDLFVLHTSHNNLKILPPFSWNFGSFFLLK